MLKLRFTNNQQNAVWLVEPKVTIGSSSECDLVLDSAGLQSVHAEIRVRLEQLQLVLLVDDDKTFVNGAPVAKGVATPLKATDNLRLGRVAMQVIDPKQERVAAPTQTRQAASTGWALKANHAALANRVFAVETETLVGRSSDCDISLAAAHLSRRHAQLSVKDGLLYVRDLDSANGTYLNGKRISESRVQRGDDLRFDTLSFGVIGPADDLDKTTIRPVLKASDVKIGDAKAGRASASPTVKKAGSSRPTPASSAAVSSTPANKSPSKSAHKPTHQSSSITANKSAQKSHVESVSVEKADQATSSRSGFIIGVGLILVIAAGVYVAVEQGLI